MATAPVQGSALPPAQDPATAARNTTTNESGGYSGKPASPHSMLRATSDNAQDTSPSKAAADEPPVELVARLTIDPRMHARVKKRMMKAPKERGYFEVDLHRLHWMNFLDAKIALFMMPMPKNLNESLQRVTGERSRLEDSITRHTTATTEWKSVMEQYWAFRTVNQKFPFFSLEININEVARGIATVAKAIIQYQEWLAISSPHDASASEQRLKTAQKDLDDFYASAPDYFRSFLEQEMNNRMRRMVAESVTFNTWSRSFYRRLLAAILGGLALVAPMLIMVLHPTLLTAVITSVTFVITVGGLMAFFMLDAQPKDIVSASAAYAAVVVVFVGATLESDVLQQSTLSNGVIAAIAVGIIVGLVLAEVVASIVIYTAKSKVLFNKFARDLGTDTDTE